MTDGGASGKIPGEGEDEGKKKGSGHKQRDMGGEIDLLYSEKTRKTKGA